MKILFCKTSDYFGHGNVRDFENLDIAIKCLIEECSNDGKYGRNPELIVYQDEQTRKENCDYTIEFYDDWRE